MKILYTTIFLLLCITLNAQIANDNCENAIPIGEVIDETFSTIGATTDGPFHADSPCLGASDDPSLDSLYNDIWYLYSPTFSGFALYSLCGTADFDTKIAVYQSGATCPLQDSDLLDCNEDAGTCANSTSEVVFQVTEGESYLLRLAGFGTSSPGEEGQGLFSVTEFVPGVANDFCSGAIDISVGLGQEFDSFSATTDGPMHDPANPCFQFGDNSIQSDIWYNFTPDFSGPVLWATCDNVSFDTRLGVYGPDVDCVGLSDDDLFECNDDGSGCANYSSSLFFEVEEGRTYLLRLGGWNGATGDGTFDLINQSPPEPPANDLCADAIPFDIVPMGNNEANSGTTIAAGFDPANFTFPPCLANQDGGEFAEVWYSFNNGGTEEVILNFFSLSLDAAFFIDIWEDCSTPTDTLLVFNNCTFIDAESLVLTDTLGLLADTPTDYLLRVSTRLTSDLPGNFDFQLVGLGLSGFDTPSALGGDVKLSPNPASNTVNIELPLNRKSSFAYSIRNMLGQEMIRQEVGNLPSGTHHQSIDIESLNTGVYIVNMIIDNEPIGIKFVKE